MYSLFIYDGIVNEIIFVLPKQLFAKLDILHKIFENNH